MNFVPSAYAQRWDGKYWLFVTTPSGAVVRLISAYNNQATAEDAITTLGFRLIPPPTKPTDRPTLTLHRGITNPK